MSEDYQLKQRQQLPLHIKIKLTESRIKQWYEYYHGKVHVSFSGGKDSTVLLDIVRKLYPLVPAVFVDTGLEFPEIRQFVKTIDNVEWLKPKMNFKKVLDKYGFPVVSKSVAEKVHKFQHSKSERHKSLIIHGNPEKGNASKLADKWHYLLDSGLKISHKCCDVMKKDPFNRYEKDNNSYPINGVMAEESDLRKRAYNERGCNAFDLKHPISSPLSFWLESDIWDYIRLNGVKYSSIYDMGYHRTGCVFCMFGVHFDEGHNNRFQMMATTHPKLYDYCINNLGCGHALDIIGAEYRPQGVLF